MKTIHLKKLTPAQWEQFTSEVAETQAKKFPDGRKKRLYMDFLHPRVTDFLGIAWKGTERDQWEDDVDRKYQILKHKNKLLLRKK